MWKGMTGEYDTSFGPDKTNVENKERTWLSGSN
jgi:hypothetical protein